jgi:hypothetical protein
MSKFTVEERGKCVIIYGFMPVDWLSRFSKMMPGALVAPHLAQMLGAHFAFGLKADVDALIAELKPQVEARVRAEPANSNLSHEASIWLASGERGVSSNTIFSKLTGVDSLDNWTADCPSDVWDLRRCRLLLEQVPELVARFPQMATASKRWSALVREWDTICRVMDEELPNWRNPKLNDNAPMTYKLLKQAVGH